MNVESETHLIILISRFSKFLEQHNTLSLSKSQTVLNINKLTPMFSIPQCVGAHGTYNKPYIHVY